ASGGCAEKGKDEDASSVEGRRCGTRKAVPGESRQEIARGGPDNGARPGVRGNPDVLTVEDGSACEPAYGHGLGDRSRRVESEKTGSGSRPHIRAVEQDAHRVQIPQVDRLDRPASRRDDGDRARRIGFAGAESDGIRGPDAAP